jgi:3-phosphoshikimate 1-carboxyvinyltransferase
LNVVVPPARSGAGVGAASGDVVVRHATRLRGTLRLPGDKSVSHRALLLAALADGTTRITGAGDGDDVRTTARLVEALGVRVDRRLGANRRGVDYVVRSPGIDGLVEPDDVLDCGNSGTSLRLLAGILATRPWSSVLTGDASLRRRPIGRIARPLRAMGATVSGRRDDTLPPLAVRGRVPLMAIDHETEVPSAQVKSALLLAGLGADGVTTVSERVATRDHTERMLRGRGVAVTSVVSRRGQRVSIEGGQRVRAVDEAIPGDVSAAAFWLVAGAIHPDADLVLEDVGLNPTRTAVLDVLGRMGADIDVDEAAVVAAPSTTERDAGEPLGRVRVRTSELRAVVVDPEEVAAAIDEIPVLCLAASQASGTTRFRGVGELRVKESDRVAGVVAGLSALGATIAAVGDELVVSGPTPLVGGATNGNLDHRLAMTFAIAGLVAAGETSIGGAASASVSYPGFFEDLEGVQA